MNTAAPPRHTPAPAEAPPPAGQLRGWLQALGEGLLQREVAVHLVLLAAVAREHVLLLGPPGTAKSLLARRLHRAFQGAHYFERLLTRFSTPEELFGPLSLKALEDDRHERLTAGYLPEAGIAFLDEVFKANSAILNALLTLLNERAFDNGTVRLQVPLVSLVGASNEVPGDEGLQAFHDRFLLRVPVEPVDDAAFAALLAMPEGDPAGDAPQPLTAAQCLELRRRAQAVLPGPEFVDACRRLRSELAGGGAPMSDRRWRQLVALCRTAAASEGRTALDALDLWLVPYVAAATPDRTPGLQDWFLQACVQAPPQAAPWLEHAVTAFEQQLALEQSLPEAEASDKAGKMALAQALGDAPGPQTAGPQRIVSARVEALQRRRFSPVHVAARTAQVDDVLAAVVSHQAAVAQERDALAARLAPRLWWPPGRVRQVLARHDTALALLQSLQERLQAAREGFAALPQGPAAPDDAPPAPLQPLDPRA